MTLRHKKSPRNAAEDQHAHECYSCEYGSRPPKSTPQCRGCINRDSRPNWVIRADYSAAAAAAIAKAASAK